MTISLLSYYIGPPLLLFSVFLTILDFIIWYTSVQLIFFSAQNLPFDKTHWNKKSQMRAIPLLVTWLLYMHSKSGKICVKWKPRNGTQRSFQIALLFCGSKTKIPVHQLWTVSCIQHALNRNICPFPTKRF